MSDDSEDEHPRAWDNRDDYDSEHSDMDQGHDFIDLEADETGDEADETGDDDDDDRNDSDDNDDGYGYGEENDVEPISFYSGPTSFPKFNKLPMELRLMIWELVDPYLKSPRRVMEFSADETPYDNQSLVLYDHMFLEQQTRGVRTLLAVNKESRNLALKYYPDAVKILRGTGCVPFNSSTDVLLLFSLLEPYEVLSGLRDWCSNAKYVGLDLATPNASVVHRVMHPAHAFDEAGTCRVPDGCNDLKAVFLSYDEDEEFFIEPHNREWTASANSFTMDFTEEGELGLDTALALTWLWADDDGDLGLPQAFRKPEEVEPGFVQVWPMMIKQQVVLDPSTDEDGSSISDSEPDDYQIDDFVTNDDPVEDEASSDDEESDGYIDPDSTDLHHGDVFNGFSPFQDGPSGDEESTELRAAAFSSPEPESPMDRLSISSEDEEDVRPRKGIKRRVVLSDDENDGADASSRPAKRARVVLSDSEDEDEGEGDPITTMDDDELESNSDQYEDEDSDEGDEDEDDEEQMPVKPMSLMAKLRQFRSEVPVSDDEPDSAEDLDDGLEEIYDEEGFDEENPPGDDEYPESPDDLAGDF